MCTNPLTASMGAVLIAVGIAPWVVEGSGIVIKNVYDFRRQIQDDLAARGRCFKCGIPIEEGNDTRFSKKRRHLYHKRCDREAKRKIWKDVFRHFKLLGNP